MEKLTDLRFIIGTFFTLCGVILLVSYFAATENNHPELNLYSGSLMLLFGIVMLLFSYKGDRGNG